MTVSGTKKKAGLAERLSQNSVFLSGAALVLSLIVAGIVMLIAGYSPIEGYSAMFTGAFGNVSNLAQTLGTATPLIFAGLAMAFAARGGMFNIGIEGQIIAGAFPAALVGAYVQGLPWFLHIPLCFLAGMIGGGVWAAIAGFLKNKLRVSEVILTIMLNYVAQYLAEYLANYQFKAEGMLVRTETILPSAALTPLVPYTRLTGGIFVALAFAVLMWWFLSRTTAGYQIRAISANPYAAEAGGINIARMNLLTMFLSGAISGLVGFIVASGANTTLYDGVAAGVGFTSITVAWLSQLNAFAMIVISMMLAIISKGAETLQTRLAVPASISDIITGILLFCMLGCEFFINYRLIFRSSKTEKEAAKE